MQIYKKLIMKCRKRSETYNLTCHLVKVRSSRGSARAAEAAAEAASEAAAKAKAAAEASQEKAVEAERIFERDLGKNRFF
ncbi:MAG: hypothetical protein Ct9H300mP4_02490 [Gammaproteobacteria bacterium]|nr:MAG: hypothetical protein Ct9H300mP4_02490 [Gammaproteobacteria bacterium]